MKPFPFSINGFILLPYTSKIPWTEEPGGLQSMRSLRVGHDLESSLSLFTFMHWRRKQQPTPVFLPGESHGRGSLVGCCLWGRTELDTTEATQLQQQKENKCVSIIQIADLFYSSGITFMNTLLQESTLRIQASHALSEKGLYFILLCCC